MSGFVRNRPEDACDFDLQVSDSTRFALGANGTAPGMVLFDGIETGRIEQPISFRGRSHGLVGVRDRIGGAHG